MPETFIFALIFACCLLPDIGEWIWEQRSRREPTDETDFGCTAAEVEIGAHAHRKPTPKPVESHDWDCDRKCKVCGCSKRAAMMNQHWSCWEWKRMVDEEIALADKPDAVSGDGR